MENPEEYVWNGRAESNVPYIGIIGDAFVAVGGPVAPITTIYTIHEGFTNEFHRKTDVEELYRKAMGDDEYVDSLYKKWEEENKAFYELAKELDKKNLEGLSNEELLQEFNKFCKAYTSQQEIPLKILESHKVLGDEEFASLIEKEAEWLGIPTTNMLEDVTYLDETNYLMEEKEELLKVMAKMAEEKVLGGGVDLEEARKRLEGTESEKLLRYHAEKYFWLRNNYRRAVVLKPEDFLREILGMYVKIKDPQKELDRVYAERKRRREAKAELLKKCSEEVRKSAERHCWFTLWREERKKGMLMGTHLLSKFLDEAARRTTYGREELGNMIVQEFEDALSGKLSWDELKERAAHTVITIHEDGKTHMVTGEDADGMREKFMEHFFKRSETLKGIPASSGFVKGKVRVMLRESEFGTMEKGDILVTTMTRPEFVPLMRIAGGVITDEGGVTSHAAIVSREFGIPCIVGTQNATKILKTGDVVELDAIKGEVKIV